MMTRRLMSKVAALALVVVSSPLASGFHQRQLFLLRRRAALSERLPLIAAKKGFGKETESDANVPKKKKKKSPPGSTPLSSPVADFGDAMIASSDSTNVVSDEPPPDDGLTVEEREEAMLRKMGLERFEERKSTPKKTFKADGTEDMTVVPGVNLPKGAFDDEGNFNPLAFVPMEAQAAIEKSLFLTTGSLLLVFVLAGIAITYDAFMISTKATEPVFFANFMHDIVGPNFTIIGLVFLASSASLGVFKVAQFSQPEVYYSEPVDDSGGPSERETPF